MAYVGGLAAAPAAAPVLVSVTLVTVSPLATPRAVCAAAADVAACPEPLVRLRALAVMVSAAAFTVWPPLSVPVLVWKFVVSGVYTAVTACGDPATVSVDVDPLVAEPLLSVTGDPKFPPSILNCTEPVGVPPLDVTV